MLKFYLDLVVRETGDDHKKLSRSLSCPNLGDLGDGKVSKQN